VFGWLVLHVGVTYILFGHITALALFAFLRDAETNGSLVIATGVGLAPGIVASILYLSFWCIPGGSEWLYRGIIATIFLILLGVSRRGLPQLASVYRRLGKACKHIVRPVDPARIALWILVALAALIVYTGVFFPIADTDGLRHALLGHSLYLDRSLEHVAMTSPLPSGAFRSSTYPPTIHLVYAWGGLLQGSAWPDYGTRLVSPIYALLTLILVFILSERVKRGVGIFAAFALAAVTMYSTQSAANAIDSFRIFFVVAAFIWLWSALERKDRRLLALTGVLLGLSASAHTLGVLVLPVAGLAMLIFSDGKMVWRFMAAAAVVGTAAFLGAIEYARRFAVLGSWRAPFLYLPYAAGELMESRGLDTAYSILVHGILRVFTDIRSFGVVAWLAGARMMGALLDRQKRPPRLEVYVYFVALSLSILIFVAPSPSAPGWGNPRYILTVLPFLAVGAGRLMGWLSERARGLHTRLSRPYRRAVLLLMILSAAVLGLVAVFVTPSFVEAFFSADHKLEAASVAQVQAMRVSAGSLAMFLVSGFLVLVQPCRISLCAMLLAGGLSMCAAAPFICSLVRHLASPDGLLEPATAHRLVVLQIAAMICGAVIALTAILKMLVPPESMVGQRLASLRDRTLAAAPIIAVVLAMAFHFAVTFREKDVSLTTGYGLGTVRWSDEEKLRAFSGYFAGVLATNQIADSDAVVLVSRDAPYFYYATHPGIYWRDLRMTDALAAPTVQETYWSLQALGIQYVLVSTTGGTEYALFMSSAVGRLLENPGYTALVEDYESGELYALIDSPL